MILCVFKKKKMDCTNSFVVKSLWGIPFVDWEALDAIHTIGGVLLLWDKTVYEKIDSEVRCFSVSVLLKGVVDRFVWPCTRCMVRLLLALGMLCGQNLIV